MKLLLQYSYNNCLLSQTVQFKSYLLSLGIPDPVTRDSHKSNTKYLSELAKQISSFLAGPLQVTLFGESLTFVGKVSNREYYMFVFFFLLFIAQSVAPMCVIVTLLFLLGMHF